MGGSATVAVVPNRGTAKTESRLSCQGGLSISYMSIDVSDILNSLVIFNRFFFGKSHVITVGRWRRIAGVTPTSHLRNWQLWVYVPSCPSPDTANVQIPRSFDTSIAAYLHLIVKPIITYTPLGEKSGIGVPSYRVHEAGHGFSKM